MLFIAIVLVFLVYAGLYLLWDAAAVPLDGAESVLRSLANAFLRPQNEVFFILRSLLVLALLYVIADHFLVGAKRALKRKRNSPTDVQATFNETNDHVYRDS